MKLFYRKFGNGTPMIILHGLYGSSDNWVTIAKSIAEKFTVYLPDLRNHGQSPHSQIHDYDSMSMDIYELSEELNIQKFILAGHSMGGKVAVNFAIKWPEKINSLIIIDISPFKTPDPENRFYNEHKHILHVIKSIDLSKVISRGDAEAAVKGRIGSEKITSFILKNLQRTTGNNFKWKLNVNSLYDNLEKIIEGLPEPHNSIESLTGFPVLFVKGEDSDYLSNEDMKTIRKLFPSAEMVTIRNTGHWVHAERPGAITEILKNQI